MLKAVYRKIFLNKIWLQCIFVCFINLFLYKYVCAQNVSEGTEELFAFILLGMWGLVFILLFYYLLSGVSQAARFGNWLTQLPPVIRERLEYNFQTGDQIGDLHFTNSHLFVYQIRGGMHNGIICIPYEEISEVRIKPGAARNILLEICRTQNQPSHYVYYQSGVTNEMVQTINNKLDALRNRMEPLMPKTEEQKKAEKKEQRSAERNKLVDTGIIFFMRKRMYKKADEIIEWKCRWQVAGFTVLAVLFILFMGLMYSTDVGTWERLTEGYQLLMGVI